jgi:hypothetical protein
VSRLPLSPGRSEGSVSASKLRDRGGRALQLPLGHRGKRGSQPDQQKARITLFFLFFFLLIIFVKFLIIAIKPFSKPTDYQYKFLWKTRFLNEIRQKQFAK